MAGLESSGLSAVQTMLGTGLSVLGGNGLLSLEFVVKEPQ